MKKILSLFLASLMLLSLFSVAPVFAATSQATEDGGTLWHKFDFEDGSTADKINNASTTGGNLFPTIASDGNGEFFGKFTVGSGKEAYVISTSTTLETCTDRYAVFEMDFKKDDTTYQEGTTKSASPDVNFYIRKSSNRKISAYTKTEATDWTHTIIVVDKNLNANNNYTARTYTFEDGVYTHLDKDLEVTNDAINQVRIILSATYNPGKSFYIDNLEMKTYKNFYEVVNAAQSAEEVQRIIERYSGLGMVNIPEEYAGLTAGKKTEVAQKLLNKNFASDIAVTNEISTILTDEVYEKVYFDWDFEDNTINDSVNNEPFMADHPTADKNGARVVVDTDPENEDNNVAKMDFTTTTGSTDDILTYTSVINNAITAGEFDYLVFEYKVYGDQGKNVTIYQDNRNTSNSKLRGFENSVSGQTWHQIKSVFDISGKTVKAYTVQDGVLQPVQFVNDKVFDKTFSSASGFFYRIGIERAGNNCVMYFDDFKVTGYKSVVTEVNEASVNGVTAALESANEIGVINLPSAYASLDDAGKAAFAASVKSATYTSAQEINDAIAIYFSTDDLVVLSSSNDANGKLDALKLYVKKADVYLATSEIFVAAYKDGELSGLASCPQTTAVVSGTTVTLTGLALDVASAGEAKVIVVNNTTDLDPAVKALKLK